MSHLRILLAISIVMLGLSSGVIAGEMEAARWWVGKHSTIVETYQKDGAWYGKIVESKDPEAPIGRDVVLNVRKVDGVWKGKFYAAMVDKALDLSVVPNGGEMKLQLKLGWFSKVLDWTKHE